MDCTFCGNRIKKGTGTMFVKKDGKVFYYCGSKCEKNHLKLKRIPRHTTWTKQYETEKKAEKRAQPKKGGKK